MCNVAVKMVPLAMLTLSSVSALAAPITGNVVWADYFAESVKSTDLHYGNSQPYSDLEVLLICVDVNTHVPEDGPVAFEANAGSSALKGGSGAKGVAAIHWLFDQYYESVFQNGGTQGQWAFQYALWEIGNDFNGNIASIDPSLGHSKPVIDGYYAGQLAFVNSYETMYEGLIANLPSLSSGYRSTKYTLDLLRNHDLDFQNMVAVINRPPEIPTPTPSPKPVPTLEQTSLVGLSIGLALVGFRTLRRRQV